VVRILRAPLPWVAPLVSAPARQASAIVAAVAATTASTANAGRACSDPEYPGLPAW